MKLFLTLFILISCFNGIASADSIQIRCPSLNTLTFTENTNHNGWNHYQVLGYAQVLSGNIPAFVMEGNADNKGVSEMNWATYSAPDHALICLYSDASHSDFALNEVAEQNELRDCHFSDTNPLHDAFECEGNVNDCVLLCQR